MLILPVRLNQASTFMRTYFAFLRGINVGAHNRMKMDNLRAVCESIGLENVQTYIQSGNIVFETTETDERELSRTIGDAIEDEFGYDVPAMIRTRLELEEIVDRQPFEEPTSDGIKQYVTFLHDEPTDEQREQLLATQSDAERFVVSDREVYSDGRFIDIGTKLGMVSTRRNWDVVTSVLELGD